MGDTILHPRDTSLHPRDTTRHPWDTTRHPQDTIRLQLEHLKFPGLWSAFISSFGEPYKTIQVVDRFTFSVRS